MDPILCVCVCVRKYFKYLNYPAMSNKIIFRTKKRIFYISSEQELES